MHCSKCGNNVPAEASFCNKCGYKIDSGLKDITSEKAEATAIISNINNNYSAAQTSSAPKVSKSYSLVIRIITYLSAIIFYVLGRYFGLFVFVFIIPIIIADWFPRWYFKKYQVKNTLIDIIIWSNVITWFIPIIGLATSITALNISSYLDSNNKKKTLILGIICLLLTVINGWIGFYQGYTSQ